MIIMIIILTMTTEGEKTSSNGYTMIPVLPSTKDALAAVMPKSWSWDKCIAELTEMWEKQRAKGVKQSGKSAEDNQAS